MTRDKLYHAGAGFLIGIVFGLVIGPLLAFVAATLAGAAKELADYNDPEHTADLYDLVATVAGAALACLILVVAL